MDHTIVEFDYCNYKGMVAVRTVRPIRLYFGTSTHYLQEQWLLEAFDLGKQATRTFACANILSPWRRTAP